MNLLDTLIPQFVPEIKNARKVSFSRQEEIKDDKRTDKSLRREALTIDDHNRRTLKKQEQAWRDYERKKAQARRAIFRAQLALDRAQERLNSLQKPLEIGFTKEDEERVNRYLKNGGAHAKSLAGIPSFTELESLHVVEKAQVSESS